MDKLSNIIQGLNKEDLIRISEERYENQVRGLAEKIIKEDKHLVFIAGPSGSGKTTTATKLDEYLEEYGVKAYTLYMDNWYKTRKEGNMPLDEYGNIDFESPECLDLELFEKDMLYLLEGKEIKIPKFNFITGVQEYHGETLQINPYKDIVIVEGIHALGLMQGLDNVIKVYIEPNDILIDGNGVLTGQRLRLFRRIVRDRKHRGMSPEDTIKKSVSVDRGERLYIAPYKKNADYYIDSLIHYELFIHAEELGMFKEVSEILRFEEEQHIPSIGVEDIPKGSLLEEFYI